MDFEFSEEQKMIQQTAREFAETEIAPSSVERDKNSEFPTDIVKKLGELGFMGMMVSPDYDGAGMDTVFIHFSVSLMVVLLGHDVAVLHDQHAMDLYIHFKQ